MIETERLIIRKIEETKADMEFLFELLSDEEVNKYLPWYTLKNMKETKKFYMTNIKPKNLEGNGYYFVVCLKKINRLIGYVTVSGDSSHDFGYGLQEEYWGKGLITEASNAVIEFLKLQGWKYITATHDVYNSASGKVMEKIGMSYRYSYKEQWQPKDIQVTFRMYQLNFDDNQRVYQKYWEKYPEHYIEKEIRQ